MNQNRDFWKVTPFEFWAIYDEMFGKQVPESMSGSELRQLMEKYPDVKS